MLKDQLWVRILNGSWEIGLRFVIIKLGITVTGPFEKLVKLVILILNGKLIELIST